MGHYHYNCDEYCEDCLPVSENNPEVDYDAGEQDSPGNCCQCHKPLEYTLTSEGVRYVLEYITESLYSPPEKRNLVHDCYNGTWYEGSRHVEIVRDWAKDLLNYSLNDADRILVDRFLEETEK
jgi:hypothetical protein